MDPQQLLGFADLRNTIGLFGNDLGSLSQNMNEIGKFAVDIRDNRGTSTIANEKASAIKGDVNSLLSSVANFQEHLSRLQTLANTKAGS